MMKELGNLSQASSVSVDDLRSKISELQKELSLCQIALKGLTNPSLPSLGKFMKVVDPFMKNAEAVVSQLQESYEQSQQEFLSLLLYFGVSSGKAKGVNPAEFFQSIREFVVVITKKEVIVPGAKKQPGFPPR